MVVPILKVHYLSQSLASSSCLVSRSRIQESSASFSRLLICTLSPNLRELEATHSTHFICLLSPRRPQVGATRSSTEDPSPYPGHVYSLFIKISQYDPLLTFVAMLRGITLQGAWGPSLPAMPQGSTSEYASSGETTLLIQLKVQRDAYCCVHLMRFYLEN